MRKKYGKILAVIGMFAVMLTGCSRPPQTLAGTSWKITGLTALDGTEYDEAAYDAIIGTTVYCFDEQGNLNCSVNGENTGIYSYIYEKGDVKISLEEVECIGTVKDDVMKLQLGETGEAVLICQEQ